MRTVTATVEPKSRQKKTAESMTKAQKVHRQLTSGPVKSDLRTSQEAVQIAAAFYRQLKEVMRLRELGSEFKVHIAYLTPDLCFLFTKLYEPGQEKQILEFLSQGCHIMAGLLFGIRDPEHSGDWLIGAKPFLNAPLVVSALKQRMDSETIGLD